MGVLAIRPSTGASPTRDDHRINLKASPTKTELRGDAVAVSDTMDALAFVRKHLEGDGGNDVLREMIKTFAEALMAAEADAVCGAAYGQRSPERTNTRNGYRARAFDTRAGTIDLAIPNLRRGSYFPDWLLEPRRRAERALVAVVCQCYVEGVSTRRVDDIVRAMGMEGISKSQVSDMAKALDEAVEAFRTRPLDAGPTPTCGWTLSPRR